MNAQKISLSKEQAIWVEQNATSAIDVYAPEGCVEKPDRGTPTKPGQEKRISNILQQFPPMGISVICTGEGCGSSNRCPIFRVGIVTAANNFPAS
ncbi:MAG: hypothetical protein AAB838_01220 [Patescibacteria group bacterium]